ncbi:hypothetical protein M9H77_30385 [Catharanthus roseus]|uniref:Uncharacterized protein n=1 Tax=Catharanthus roseus TaxID=4058 RepID=A0ACC0A1D0_CATRO|nr:hypothetical protein M9H77_30385 [Catharanthus roseus]
MDPLEEGHSTWRAWPNRYLHGHRIMFYGGTAALERARRGLKLRVGGIAIVKIIEAGKVVLPKEEPGRLHHHLRGIERQRASIPFTRKEGRHVNIGRGRSISSSTSTPSGIENIEVVFSPIVWEKRHPTTTVALPLPSSVGFYRAMLGNFISTADGRFPLPSTVLQEKGVILGNEQNPNFNQKWIYIMNSGGTFGFYSWRKQTRT